MEGSSLGAVNALKFGLEQRDVEMGRRIVVVVDNRL